MIYTNNFILLYTYLDISQFHISFMYRVLYYRIKYGFREIELEL